MAPAENVTALVDRFRMGDLSVVTHIQECLRRIDDLDPLLHAWVEVDRDRALAAAKACDEALAKGSAAGPLFGIALGVKDIIDVAGLPTRAGAAPFAHRLPERDSAAVAALRQAGAIVLGKTATTQFAYIDPAPTRNPWNVDHTPGGSSSGSAAAVAAGMVPISLGSQTVGSVLRPAAYCGVVGFKPGHGRISVEGVHALAPTLDHVGAFGRSVADVTVIYAALTGTAPGPSAGAGFQESPLSFGLLRPFYAGRTGPELLDHLDRAAVALTEAGAWVEQVSLPFGPEALLEASNTILRVEAAAYHRELFASHAAEYAPNLRRLIESGISTSEQDYRAALDRREGFRRALAPLLENFDALLLPTAPSTAPQGLVSTGDPVFCALASMAGVPSISLPSALGEGGLPLAVQLVGPSDGESRLLAAAAWVEQRLAFSARPPLAETAG
jgi:Asp-tRNA(Asn)/Glu-tRNA(Gln) amidotransferase A subunit family amidase